jgi:glycolate dehydrogenase FAD-linked subunit
MVNSSGVGAALASLIGDQNVSDGVYETISYAHDALGWDLDPKKIPLAVAKPVSAQQVSELLKYANRENIPVYVQGAATAFKGSPRPKRPGSIILSTMGLTSFEMHEEDLYVEVGAGFNQYELEERLLKHGYMLPMNVGSKYSSTIGGAVAVNTIGHMVDICLGRIIDYVMGLEVVLPTGAIIETGTRSIRRPAGIDYTRFFAGNEGVFGIITKVRLRLLPEFKKSYVVGFFPALSDIAHAFMSAYQEKMPPPLYGEFLEKGACELPFRLRDLGKPVGHMCLVTTIAHTQEEADRQAAQMVRVFETNAALEARIVTSPQEQENYWSSRDNILNILHEPEEGERLLRSGGLEATAPLSHLADLLEHITTGHHYNTLHEAKILLYGHIGTCDVHGMWVSPPSWSREKRVQCAREADCLETDVNIMWGCASGEVGQTGLRIPFLKKRYGDDAYSMLMGFKKSIDPNNILNPGNLEGE